MLVLPQTVRTFGISMITFAALLAIGCQDRGAKVHDWNTLQGPGDRVAIIEGLSGPEAVRYDPEQDVYFISNFNGESSGDSNGFISRASAEGDIEVLHFMEGTAEAPLHGPRGMIIVGDTLWAADAQGLHGFDRFNGNHIAFIDFTLVDPGFLNDVAATPEGLLFVTDTGKSRLYRVDGRALTVAAQLQAPPNGITWDAASARLLIAPWEGSSSLGAIVPGDTTVTEFGSLPGGHFDGLEFAGSRIVIASQNDQRIHVVENGVGRELINTKDRAADIAIDTKRNRIAVPYVAMDRVDIWALPN